MTLERRRQLLLLLVGWLVLATVPGCKTTGEKKDAGSSNGGY